MGFVPGSCSPHYDGEAERRPAFHRLLVEGAVPAGSHEAVFRPEGLPSGVYLYRLTVDGASVASRRMLLVK